METPHSTEYKNALKSEHLNSGIKPIMVCVDTTDHRSEFEKKDFREKMPSALHVNFYAYPEDLDDENIKNAGIGTYAVSPVNEQNKFSRGYCECTGIVVSGIDKETGKNISFLSHQDPNELLTGHPEKFSADVHSRLLEIKNRCKEGTIDAVIAGGNYITKKGNKGALKSTRENYGDVIPALSEEVRSVLGFDPAVVVGPKNVPGDDHLYFDNDNRRLYVFRPETGDVSTESYMPKDFEKQEKKWAENMYVPKEGEDEEE
ncbi:MAG: hypothetical protein WC878_07475 [Candidatus Paceibacterota bacterium]